MPSRKLTSDKGAIVVEFGYGLALVPRSMMTHFQGIPSFNYLKFQLEGIALQNECVLRVLCHHTEIEQANIMEAVFSRIAQETTNFALGDEDVCEI